ncbi:uncharacterized protein LOC117584545 [Drosophila guanche]|uniref:Uncharacterized protein n=1 Tax=Drosophila guanche TaxID=7266 RepID=A0A3B0JHJ2_DROGU|nr:uncharacterized protein LOC117584545 [Drosophila guanche]SPP81874.1 Hypothetical predicted protein [Drosophila guanche]
MELTMSSRSHIHFAATEMENDWMRFNIDISEEVRYHHRHKAEMSRNPGGGLGNRIKERAKPFEEPNKFYAQSHDLLQSDRKRSLLENDRPKEYTKSRKHFHRRACKTVRNSGDSPEGNGNWYETPKHEFNNSERAFHTLYPTPPELQREWIRARAQAYADPEYPYHAHGPYQIIPRQYQYHEARSPPKPRTDHLSFAEVPPVAARISPSYRDLNHYSETPSHDVLSGEYLVSRPSISSHRQPWERPKQVMGTVPPECPSTHNSPDYYYSNSYHDFKKHRQTNGNSNYKDQAVGGTPREFSDYDFDARAHPPCKPSPKDASKYYNAYENTSHKKAPTKSDTYYKLDPENEFGYVPIKLFDRYYNSSETVPEQYDSVNCQQKNASAKTEKMRAQRCQDCPFLKEDIPHRKAYYADKKKHQFGRASSSQQCHSFANIPQPLKYPRDYSSNIQKSKKNKTSQTPKRAIDHVEPKYNVDGSEIPRKILTDVHLTPVEIPYRRRHKSVAKSLDAGCDTMPSASELTIGKGSRHSLDPQSRAIHKYNKQDGHPGCNALKDGISGLVKKSKACLNRSKLFKSKSLLLKGYKPVNCFNFSSMVAGMSRKTRGERSYSGAEKNKSYPTMYRGQGEEITHADDGRKYHEYSMFNVHNTSERSRDKNSESCGAYDYSADECSVCDKYLRSSDNWSRNSVDDCSENFSDSSSDNCGDNCSDDSGDNCSDDYSNNCRDSYSAKPNHCGNDCNCHDNEFREVLDPVQPSQINICLTIRTADASLAEPPRVTSSESKCHGKSTAACTMKSQPTQTCRQCHTGCATPSHWDTPRSSCGENLFENVRIQSPRTCRPRTQSKHYPNKCHKSEAPIRTPPMNEGKRSRPSLQRGHGRSSCDKKQPLRPTIRPCSKVPARSKQKRVVLNTNCVSQGTPVESKRAGHRHLANTRSYCTAKSVPKNSTTSLSSCPSGKGSSSCGKEANEKPVEHACPPNPVLGDNVCPGGAQSEYSGNFAFLTSCNTTGPIERGDLCCPKLVAEWDQDGCRCRTAIESLKQELLQNLRTENPQPTPHMMFLPCQPNACPFACWTPDPVVSWPPCPMPQAPCSF